MITRKPKLRRQRKIFRQQGKLPRPDQMNINAAAWGRLLRRNFFFPKSGDISEGGPRLEKQSSTTGSLYYYNQHRAKPKLRTGAQLLKLILYFRLLSSAKSFKF